VGTGKESFSHGRFALFIFGICGIAGVLIDIDHPLSMLLWLMGVEQAGHRINPRFLHLPIFIIVGLVFVCVVSCAGRLALGCILERRKGLRRLNEER
jgi:hypothetical protein